MPLHHHRSHRQNLNAVSSSFVKPKARAVTEEDTQGSVFKRLRIERANARLVGIREKRAIEAAEAAARKLKKNK